jgi:hypothetical protein
MYRKLLITVVLGVPLLCSAATSTWEAFDYVNCRHWQITTDYRGYGKDYERAKQVVKSLSSPEPESLWQVLYGVRMFEETEDQYGVCITQENKITCDPGTAFPLAGATLIQKRPQTFICSKGCKSIQFPVLYEMGYEDGGDSAEYAPAKRRFERQCHEKRRAKEFFERLDKNR